VTEALDGTLAALADPVRRGIVELLRVERRRPSEIAAELGVSRTALSRHLRVLRDAGLVTEEIDGSDARGRLLGLEPRPLSELRGWLDDVSAYWTGQLDAFRVHAEGKAAPKPAGGKKRRR